MRLGRWPACPLLCLCLVSKENLLCGPYSKHKHKRVPRLFIPCILQGDRAAIRMREKSAAAERFMLFPEEAIWTCKSMGGMVGDPKEGFRMEGPGAPVYLPCMALPFRMVAAQNEAAAARFMGQVPLPNRYALSASSGASSSGVSGSSSGASISSGASTSAGGASCTSSPVSDKQLEMQQQVRVQAQAQTASQQQDQAQSPNQQAPAQQAQVQVQQQAANAAKSCSACGKAAGEGEKLKKCSACRSVLYCGDACARSAWPAHKPVCMQLRKQGGGAGGV